MELSMKMNIDILNNKKIKFGCDNRKSSSLLAKTSDYLKVCGSSLVYRGY